MKKCCRVQHMVGCFGVFLRLSRRKHVPVASFDAPRRSEHCNGQNLAEVNFPPVE